MTNEFIEYVAQQNEEHQNRLTKVLEYISSIKENDVTEIMSYQMPTYKGRINILHVGYAQKHIGLYPGAEVIVLLKESLKDYECTKGTIKLPHDKELDLELIKLIYDTAVEINT